MDYRFDGVTTQELLDWITQGVTFRDKQLFYDKTKPYIELLISNRGLESFKAEKQELAALLVKECLDWPEFNLYFAKRFPEHAKRYKNGFDNLHEACWFFQKDVLINKIEALKPGIKFPKSQKKEQLIDVFIKNSTVEQQRELRAEAESVYSLMRKGIFGSLWGKTLFEVFYGAIFKESALRERKIQMLADEDDGPFASPFWLMRVDPRSEKCISKYGSEGVFKHRDDPFWIQNYPLHQAFDCYCNVSSRGKRHIEKDVKLQSLLEKSTLK